MLFKTVKFAYSHCITETQVLIVCGFLCRILGSYLANTNSLFQIGKLNIYYLLFYI